jgi:hypothetical protein
VDPLTVPVAVTNGWPESEFSNTLNFVISP